MADEEMNQVIISSSFSAKLTKWRVCEGQIVKEGNVLAFYEKLGQSDEKKAFITQPKLKSSRNGRVRKFLVSEGEIVQPGKPVAVIEQARICEHKTIMKDLCCDCGADLRKLHGDNDEPSSPNSATISMIHNIPET
ncbi:predicted protein [Nematostella vectensis]|uniref:FCP1 barrel-sandwich hybrid domain-containing protein n=1 Tax=Nematostella vectensis TaxID=45351 RepID=A7S819_NEMVE|nr:predicted protein [Nematostella vectensis]|eukprot:XP_001632239.1 predicted protein [Nematostella vectensis]